MNLLAFSDLHLSRRHAAELVDASRDADLVIGAGDFCNMRQGLDKAFAMLAPIKAPMAVVPGNAESDAELRAVVPQTVSVLHGQAATVAGLRLYGLGGGVPVTPFGAWSFDLDEAQAETMLADCDIGVDIMVFHSPPKGVADVTSQGMSVGSSAIRAAIERVQPRLALCGHIHDSWGRRGKIGQTEVVNLGPTPNWFEL